MKATEAPALIRQERRLRLGLSQVGSDGWYRMDGFGSDDFSPNVHTNTMAQSIPGRLLVEIAKHLYSIGCKHPFSKMQIMTTKKG